MYNFVGNKTRKGFKVITKNRKAVSDMLLININQKQIIIGIQKKSLSQNKQNSQLIFYKDI